jgi:pyruvate,water dikinase
MTRRDHNTRLGWYTVDLQVTASDPNLVGGKAAGLEALRAAGCRVPEGFTVTTRGYDEVLEREARAASALEQLSDRVRVVELPAALVDEVAMRMRRVEGVERWVVRSSAVGEDAASESFAGIHESVVGAEDLDEVLDAIRTVWASGLTTEAVLYRERMGLEPTPEAMAVVVQRMLSPSSGGVMFSSNPVSGEDELVVSASRQGAQAVVEGVAGSTYYVEKSTGYARRVEHHGGEGEVLTPAQVRELARTCRAIEARLGGPQDIEWAYCPEGEGDELYLLQARAVTTDASEGAAPQVWTNTNVGEALPGVGTPLTWSVIKRFSRKGFERAFGTLGLTVPREYELVGSFSGRVYLNLTEFMSVASAIPFMKPSTLFELAGGGGAELVQEVYERRSSLSFIARLPVTVPRVVAAQLSMPVVAPMWESYFTARCKRFFQMDLTRRNHTELAGVLEDVERLFDLNGMVMLTVSSNFLMTTVVAREALRLLGGETALSHERALFSGLNVRSAEPGFALLELGRKARRSLRLRRLVSQTPTDQVLDALKANSAHEDVADFLEQIEEFRAAYGHRAPREAEIATPRWREDTTFVFEVIKGFIESPSLPSSLELMREQERAQKEAHEALDDIVGGSVGGALRWAFTFARGNARRREAMRSLVVDSLDMYREVLLECGKRMVKVGQIDDVDDVFFITVDEVRAWLADASVAEGFGLSVLARKAIHDTWRGMPDPPGTFSSRGGEVVADASYRALGEVDETFEMNGLPGSSGRVTGRARVMFDPREEPRLAAGEVLVVPYADVGWTPLFLSASAVVMSLGGPLSHACVVAREYGIPAVVNAIGATEVIRSGDLVTVDGDRGIVWVRREDAPE